MESFVVFLPNADDKLQSYHNRLFAKAWPEPVFR